MCRIPLRLAACSQPLGVLFYNFYYFYSKKNSKENI